MRKGLNGEMMYRVKWLEQTSDCGCPSMWEGETDDDRFIYIRWRGDVLRAVVGNHNKEYYDKGNYILEDCTVVYMADYYASDGWLTTKKMEKILSKHFIF